MSTLIVPPRDETPWPSLGPLVVDWIEDNLVFGPGDLLGEPAKVDRETRAIIRRAYEIYPRGHAFEGRRRFLEVSISLPKGTAKTERAAWIAIAESHPESPVRFVDWNEDGTPVGWSVTDPYIPLLASTEGQSEDTTYDAVKAILERSTSIRDDYNIGLGKITRNDGRGKMEAVATSPDSLDGKRTTFEVFDETHRLVDDREKKSHSIMLANVVKRKTADGWALGTTTAFVPGKESIAEETMEEAKQILGGEVKNPSLFFFHRQADDGHDFEVEEEVRQGLEEAYGPSAEWAGIDSKLTLWAKPKTDRNEFERLFLNRPTLARNQVFDPKWVRAAIENRGVPWVRDRSEVCLGFDGSMTHDTTALIGTELESGYQFVVGCWKRPEDWPEDERWEVDAAAVDQAFHDAMKRWKVKVALCDRNFWETYVDTWCGKWPKVVANFPTSALKKTAYAVRNYVHSFKTEQVKIDGHVDFVRHLINAQRKELTMKDEDGKPLYLMEKPAKNSLLKIDCAYAGCLSWEARAVAIQGGALKRAGSKAGRTTVYMG